MSQPPTFEPSPDSRATGNLGEDLSLEMDVYCQGCGYNLRGQPGDPKRCPECGLENAVYDMTISSEQITKQLQLLESAPSFCFGSAVLGFMGHSMVLANLDDPVFLRRAALLWGPLCLFTYIALPLSARRFAATCMHQPGWGWALFKFNLYAIVIFVVGLGAIPGSFLIPESLFGPNLFAGTAWRVAEVAAILCFVLVWFVAITIVRKYNRKARNCIAPLQRQVAVQMYHDRDKLGSDEW